MANLFVNGKIFSLGGEFWVEDEAGNEKYRVKGSFLKIPKSFHIYDHEGQDLAKVTHKVVSLLPKFTLEIGGAEVATIAKKFTLLKARYEVQAAGLDVRGNILDMNFEILRAGQVIGRVDKAWVSIRDKYQIEVLSPADELLVLGIVLAIDYVKREAAAAASAT